MGGRKIRDEADARGCIASVKRAGVELAQWARAEGIDGRSLRAWATNLERRSRTRTKLASTRGVAKVRLVELVPTTVEHARSLYVIRVGERSVEVDAGFDEGTLRRVLAVLAAC